MTSLTERRCLGCKAPINRPKICCADCWRELPPELRMRATNTRYGTGAGLDAVRDVADWFRKAQTS